MLHWLSWLEQPPCKRQVIRSNRICSSNLEDYRSGHNEAVLKTVCRKRHEGSNPPSSANYLKASTAYFYDEILGYFQLYIILKW